MYRKLDKLLAEAKKRIRVEFNRMGLMGFDELNVVNTKKVTSEMFDRLLADNEKMYQKAAKSAYKAAGGDKESEPDIEWVLGVLMAYNFVTGYLYDKEADRKRLRLNEQILTAREYDDRGLYNSSLQRTANLWWTQTSQYGIDIVDKATLQAYKDLGVKKVRWKTVVDKHTCKVCKERSDKVFDISKVPEKSHYNCRCYLEPVVEE